MAVNKKLNDQQFMGALDALGGNQRRLAEELGVSPAAICKRVKRILGDEAKTRGRTAKVVKEFDGRKPQGVRKDTFRRVEIAIGEGSREVDQKLDVVAMMLESNAILTSLLKEVRDEVAAKGKSNPLQRKQLLALAERLQSQAKGYFDIQASLYNSKMIKHFMDAVLYVVSQESPELQRAIYVRLRDSGSLFQSPLGIPEASGS